MITRKLVLSASRVGALIKKARSGTLKFEIERGESFIEDKYHRNIWLE